MNPKFHCYVHNGRQFDSNLSQMNSIHIPAPMFFDPWRSYIYHNVLVTKLEKKLFP
jgi:hypothetical protein